LIVYKFVINSEELRTFKSQRLRSLV